MSRSLPLLLFAAFGFVNATPAFACSPSEPDIPSDSGSVSSVVPAKNVPKGVIQLKVEAPDIETVGVEAFSAGKMTLRVKQVLNGKFSEPTILLNSTNVDNCISWFEPQFEDFFISVLPMEYTDGQPVLDRGGKQEFGALFYKDPGFFDEPPEEGSSPDDQRAPLFAEYMPMKHMNLSFNDPLRFECLWRESNEYANWPAETWRRCVNPEEYVELDCEQKEGKLICTENETLLANRPIELRRGYNFSVYHQTTIFSILLTIGLLVGLGYFFHRRKLRTS